MPQPILLVGLSEIGKAKTKEEVTAALTEELKSVNEHLSSYKKVAAIVVIKNDFSIESGTLTPTLKIKRPQIHLQYADRLLDWIESRKMVIWE